jgi:hypothetical protein
VAWDAAGASRPEDYTDRGLDPALVSAIADTDGVAAVAVVGRQLVAVDGVGTPTFTVQPPPGADDTPIDLVLTDGREPTEPDEIAMGPATADRLGVGIGDTVTVGESDDRWSIVGLALFPSDVHATFDDGIWMTEEGFGNLELSFTSDGVAYPDRSVVVDFDDDTSVADGLAALSPITDEHFDEFGPAEVPAELTNLSNVRTLPVLLAGFLVLLAIGALGHTLATAAHRRSLEFAVLRALGLSKGGSRLVFNTQGTVVGLVLGVPLGIVLGRIGWGLVAESVPLAVVRPVAAAAVVALVPLALLVANGLAVWPGNRAARLQPAEVLRAE